jgi:hypothetical protein
MGALISILNLYLCAASALFVLGGAKLFWLLMEDAVHFR